MKKQYYYSVLALLLVSIITPTIFIFANAEPAMYNIAISNIELAQGYDGATQSNIGLPEVTPWWIDMIDKEKVDNDGEGVTIAVLDTGLLTDAPFFLAGANIRYDLGIGFTHEINEDGTDLKEDLIVRDFWTNEYGSGHGTHVTSTIVGFNVNNAFWVQGVAPKAQIIPVLVLDAWAYDGELVFTGGTNEMISAGINYVSYLVEYGIIDGPVIINMSLGGPSPSNLIKEAIDYAMNLGIMFVVSAGNEGEAGMGYPGAYDEVISCAMGGWSEYWWSGWTGDVPEDFNTPDAFGNNHIAFLHEFSSRPNNKLGQKSYQLDVVAPGVAIVGPFKDYGIDSGIGYYYLWGTSMAAPHVSGIAALVAQDFPEIRQGEMEQILKNAAHGNPLPADGTWVYSALVDDFYHFDWQGNDYGAGWLQADQALFVADATHMGWM